MASNMCSVVSGGAVPTKALGHLNLQAAKSIAEDLDVDCSIRDCVSKSLPRVSFAFKRGSHGSRVRSFGELCILEDWEKWSTDEESGDELPDHIAPTDCVDKGPLDALMLGLWDMCNEDGLFRYDVTACSTKVLPGQYGFIAQLNEGRATKKRPTEFRVDQVIQPFDDKKFNFTKAALKEVLFQFDSSAESETVIDLEATVTDSPHLVMINVSPIEYGHVLLVPSVLEKLPQLITPATMLLAIQFTIAVDNPYFRLGYNSLGAYATINHLHFQGYYLMAPYPVERAPTVELNLSNPKFQGVRISNLIDYPVKGFVIEKIGSLEIMANVLANVCTKLQENNIPHNLLICDCGTRAFLWPQCYAEKQAKHQVPENILATGVNPAAFEIAGHMVLKAKDDYVGMTQKKAWKMLAEVSLSDARFDQVIDLCFG